MRKYQIVFHDKKIYEITEQQKERIYQASAMPNLKGININGDYIAFSSIARIEKSKITELQNILTLPEVFNKLTKPERGSAMSSIIRGFKKNFEGRNIPANSQEVLNKFINRFNGYNYTQS